MVARHCQIPLLLTEGLYELEIFEFKLKHDLILDKWKELKTIPYNEVLVKPGIEVNRKV